MNDRHKAVPSVYLLLQKDGQVLLGKRCNTSFYDEWYGLPAGHVEVGELPIAGLIRECEEEIGITLEREDLKLVHTMYRADYDKNNERADYFFVADYQEKYEPTNTEPEKCTKLQWFDLDQLPENTMHYVAFAMEQIAAGQIYSELTAEQIQTHMELYQSSLWSLATFERSKIAN